MLGNVDSTDDEKSENSDEFENENFDISKTGKEKKPYRIFETAADFKAHNRRISKKYKKKSEKWMFKFGTRLFVKSVYFDICMPLVSDVKKLKQIWHTEISQRGGEW